MGEKQRVQDGLRHGTGRWLLVFVLAVAAAALLGEVLRTLPTAEAQTPTSVEDAGQLLAVSGRISDDTYGLYLINRQTGIITMYEWQPTVRKLRLLAVRNATYDMQLDEYNTEPSPGEIRHLVRQGRLLGSETRPAVAE